MTAHGGGLDMAYGSRRGDFRTVGRKALVAVLLTATAVAGSGITIRSEAFAQAQTSFDIPAGPLNQALAVFGRQAELQLSYEASIANGKTSPGFQGVATRMQAIARILQGSGLTFSFKDARNVLITQPGATAGSASAAPAGAVQLDTINVQGDQQSPTGPGVGYVATRSLSGTKTDTPIIETPQSISVVTRQQMDDQGVQSVDEALRYTSGVRTETFGAQQIYDNDTLLRGFQPDYYLDGLKLIPGNFGVASIDPYLLNRIEVIHGPASVLYGQQGTPGGIVNMTSKLPTDQSYHEVELVGGSFGHITGAFDLSGPVNKEGTFLYRLTGVGFDTGSQVDFTNQRRLAIAPAVTWKPDGDTTLTILSQYQNDHGPVSYAFIPAQGTVLPNPNGKIPTNFLAGDPNYNSFNRTQAQIGYAFEHKIDSVWTFRQNLRYQNVSASEATLLAFGLQPDLKTLNRYSFNDVDTINNITLDNQIQAKFVTGPLSHTLLGGVDYQWSGFEQATAFNFGAPSLNVFAPLYYQSIPSPFAVLSPTNPFREHQTQDQVGVYAQDQIKLDRFTLMVGGREDWAQTSTTNLGTDTKTQQSASAFTYRAGLVYEFDNGIAPYASYTTSFSPTIGTNFSGQAFLPTTGQQYEAGIKYQPIGWNSFITASAYNLTEQNVLVTDPDHPQFQTQTGEIRARGVELEGHANLTNNLNLIASFTYTNAINTKSSTTDTTIEGITESTQGKTPVNVPATIVSFWADYTFDYGLAKGFGLSGGVRYVGSSPGDDVNSFYAPAVTLFDAAIHYDLGQANSALKGLKLQVNATNLFDKQYVATCVSEASCRFGLRRTVLATLKYQW